MFKINTASRLSLFIMMIVAGTLWLALSFRFASSPAESEFRARIKEAQALACSGAAFAETGRLTNFAGLLEQVCELDPELVSAGLARPTGGYRIEVGDHSRNWVNKTGQTGQISVMIQANNQDWGTLELKYCPLPQGSSQSGWLPGYPANLVLFVSCASSLMAWIMFSRVFRYLDPSKVVPARVRSALDTLAEGLVLLDPAETIVHANEAFGRMLNIDPDSLIGEKLDQWGWKLADAGAGHELPWSTGLKSRQELKGRLLQLETGGECKQYLVNSKPIIADQEKACRGVLISFDDVTLLERKKQDLAESFQSLRVSQDEIRRQNLQLRFLASRDPLTRCLNRRAFWELLESGWLTTPIEMLNVVMVDLDHFKPINDCHGHSTGDNVLRETGAMLTHLIGDSGLVCRYGGEEFAILLPGIDLQGASDVTEAVHQAFQRCLLGGLKVTASIGLSNRNFGAMDAQHLLDQADQCLYAAKRNGRNQVVRFDNLKLLEQKHQAKPVDDGLSFERIPYLTVSALFNVVATRDTVSAGFCQELADTCAEAGQPILNRQQLYWLEVAALLHQSGTIVSSQDTRNIQRDRVLPCAGQEFQRSISASKFLMDILGDCEPVRILALVESGDHSCSPNGNANDAVSLIRQCASVFVICTRFLKCSRSGVDQVTNCNDLRSRNPGLFQEQIIRRLETRIERLVQPADKSGDVQPNVAATIARHHGDLNIAVIERNISRLAKTAEGIKSAIPEAERSILKTELRLLELAAQDRDPDYEKLGLLVDQIFEICRISRRQLISRVSIGETEQESNRIVAGCELETASGNIEHCRHLP